MSFFERLRNLFQMQKEPVRNEKPFKIYTTTMVNTITLSSDMETLYLIDNGRAIAFPLDLKDGVLIGTLKGQITVATGFRAPDEEDSSGSADASGGTRKRTLKLPVKSNSQWTATYNRKHEVLAFIGATEIDFGITEEEPIKSQIFVYDLKTKVVNMRRTGNALEIFEWDR